MSPTSGSPTPSAPRMPSQIPTGNEDAKPEGSAFVAAQGHGPDGHRTELSGNMADDGCEGIPGTADVVGNQVAARGSGGHGSRYLDDVGHLDVGAVANVMPRGQCGERDTEPGRDETRQFHSSPRDPPTSAGGGSAAVSILAAASRPSRSRPPDAGMLEGATSVTAIRLGWAARAGRPGRWDALHWLAG